MQLAAEEIECGASSQPINRAARDLTQPGLVEVTNVLFKANIFFWPGSPAKSKTLV